MNEFGARVAPDSDDADPMIISLQGLEHLIQAYRQYAPDLITIHSVLWKPTNLHWVDDIPEVMQHFGLNKWVISRALGFDLKPMQKDSRVVLKAIRTLQNTASEFGVDLTVGNDAATFDARTQERYSDLRFFNPSAREGFPYVHLRFAQPTGYLSTSLSDVFQKVDRLTPILRPGDDLVRVLVNHQPEARVYLKDHSQSSTQLVADSLLRSEVAAS